MKSVFAAIAAVGSAFAAMAPQNSVPLDGLYAQGTNEVGKPQPADRTLKAANPDKAVRQTLRGSGGYTYRHHSAGWPVAVDRRQARKARKARNVKRNRKAHK